MVDKKTGEIRFNRYIVECKYPQMDGQSMTYNRFNRYIVECK